MQRSFFYLVILLFVSGFIFQCGEKQENITNIDKKKTITDTTNTTVSGPDSLKDVGLQQYTERVEGRLDTILAIIAEKEQSLLGREKSVRNREAELVELQNELFRKQKRLNHFNTVSWTLFILGLLSALWTFLFIFFFRVAGIKKDKVKYIEWAEKKLQRLETSIDRLGKKAEAATGKAREKYQEQLENVKDRQKKVKERIINLRNAGDDAWHELREGVEKSLKTLKQSLRNKSKK